MLDVDQRGIHVELRAVLGAGFYADATEPKWADNYRMYDFHGSAHIFERCQECEENLGRRERERRLHGGVLDGGQVRDSTWMPRRRSGPPTTACTPAHVLERCQDLTDTLVFWLGAGFYVDATEAKWAANYRLQTMSHIFLG